MADPHPVVSYSKREKFGNVRDDLKLAIEGKGLVIDYQSFVGSMLERTGKDLGSPRKLFTGAQAFVFCSAVLSRKTMEADIANAALCPYSILVYATVQDPRTVHVSYRRAWRPDGSAASSTTPSGAGRWGPPPRRRSRRSRHCSTASRARRSGSTENPARGLVQRLHDAVGVECAHVAALV